MNRNDIYIIHGTDYKEMTIHLLTEAGLAQEIGYRSRHIALNPNLLGTILPDTGATTHTELVCGTIEYLQSHGFRHITIMEGSWVGDSTQRAYKDVYKRQIFLNTANNSPLVLNLTASFQILLYISLSALSA